eukprot:CAMPEP_0171987974 /NCGR_PEP_ID=MMETSP0993-20121228/275665_1 /TAXON_ID=483369 /ORGANISM="non described non described, Strain CCMP2098" /LENGTH=38 /DNA_ID= /DNA_START= /DNA_END= /DNA_ORIENTATION=
MTSRHERQKISENLSAARRTKHQNKDWVFTPNPHDPFK